MALQQPAGERPSPVEGGLLQRPGRASGLPRSDEARSDNAPGILDPGQPASKVTLTIGPVAGRCHCSILRPRGSRVTLRGEGYRCRPVPAPGLIPARGRFWIEPRFSHGSTHHDPPNSLRDRRLRRPHGQPGLRLLLPRGSAPAGEVRRGAFAPRSRAVSELAATACPRLRRAEHRRAGTGRLRGEEGGVRRRWNHGRGDCHARASRRSGRRQVAGQARAPQHGRDRQLSAQGDGGLPDPAPVPRSPGLRRPHHLRLLRRRGRLAKPPRHGAVQRRGPELRPLRRLALDEGRRPARPALRRAALPHGSNLRLLSSRTSTSSPT